METSDRSKQLAPQGGREESLPRQDLWKTSQEETRECPVTARAVLGGRALAQARAQALGLGMGLGIGP